MHMITGVHSSTQLKYIARICRVYVTLYQYMSRQDVRQGTTVKAGQQIGSVGDTGISSGPHLHYEVHENGTPVDPMKFSNSRPNRLHDGV